MRIGMILDKEYPPDVRVRREARALTSAGHEVLLVARNRKGAAREQRIDGMRVLRLPPLDFAGARAARWLSLPVPVNPFYLAAITRLVHEEDVDVLHVHDLPLVMAAVAIAKTKKVPVVFDLHEDYPSMIADEVTSTAGRIVFKELRALHRLERVSLAAADHCLVVVEEQRQRLIGLGVAPERVTVVPNVLDLADLPPAPEYARPPDDEVVFLYTGIFGPTRGLAQLLDAMAKNPKEPAMRVVLVGDGEERAALERQAKALGLEDRVTFAGWQPHDRLGEYMASANVGLVPHVKTPHVETTMPNKIYEFLAYGLPLVTSDAAPLARLVDEAECGVAVDVEDPERFAAALFDMASNVERRRGYGAAGRRFVVNRHNWSKLGAPALLGAYASLFA